MNIPQDPFMLLSFVNMKLRDGDYSSLEDFCSSNDIEKSELVSKLAEAGFEYNSQLNQFR